MVTAPFIPILTVLIGLKTRDMMDRRWAQLARMGAHFLDMIQGLPTLKLFGQSQPQAAGIEEVSNRYGRSTMDVLRVALLHADHVGDLDLGGGGRGIPRPGAASALQREGEGQRHGEQEEQTPGHGDDDHIDARKFPSSGQHRNRGYCDHSQVSPCNFNAALGYGHDRLTFD